MSSRRGYLTQTELAEFADITITNATEADDQISMAEEQIDAFVGPQDKFLNYEIRGLVSAGGGTTFTLENSQQNMMQNDFLKGCWVEVMGGTGEGQLRKITGQTLAGVITVDTAFSPAVDATSFYRIYQLGKFPRHCDTEFYNLNSNYYKSIPEKIRRAVAAQVEYIVQMGAAFFSTDASVKTAERIGDYSYEKSSGSGNAPVNQIIAPKAKQILAGLVNRKGTFVRD